MNEKLVERIVVVILRLSFIWSSIWLGQIIAKSPSYSMQANEMLTKLLQNAHKEALDEFFKEK